ncbi:MAG: nucleoside monophosphate kinase [Roseibacillus sp.]|nr:nucleoside monophosphate kinase [Roseibacillus sp.]
MSEESRKLHSSVLIIGAPGSGKGTQGKVLGTIPRFFHCACGDVFRSLDTRTDLGQQFVEFSSKGELVPDQLTIDLWKAQIDNWIETYFFKPDIDMLILDGIPRNVHQAEILEDYLEVHRVIHLTCPDREELARRMRKRALKDNRYDDASDEVIAHRIETYDEETRPLIEHYEGRVSEIDATQQPVEVLGDVIAEIVKLDVYKEMAKVLV